MKTLKPTSSTPQPGPVIRRRLELRGRVQGVGFRPFAWRLADELGLAGQVGNHAQGAWVEVEGLPQRVDRYIERLRAELPLPGRIDSLTCEALPVRGDAHGFHIQASALGGPASAEVVPDLGVCPDCLRELNDPADRRFHYPFINCTHCGPRYSIVLGLPYDRASTTMGSFELCDACRREYEDPSDRRFHAQPEQIDPHDGDSASQPASGF